ncbi:MAG: GNAT family N-acetyltransferase [Campylobacteraceae bacterium]|jgi:ribosomal-protein-alanine N-acetyltransferase|nr:GNAT family N-acetyltransferase [Campylobacteraceae bacterium]
MTIKAAKREDLNALCEIEAEAFDENSFALSRRNFLYHIDKNSIFICEIEGSVAGYILLLTRKNSIRIYSLAVKKEFRSCGVGLKLLEKSIAHAKDRDKKSINLEVNAANLSAIRLYEKVGFVKTGVALKYYPDGADAVLMEKVLS